MTEREIANAAYSLIQMGLTRDAYPNLRDRTAARRVLAHFRRRLDELDGDEKEEPKHDLVLDRLSALEARADFHSHNTEGTTGPPI